LLLQTNIFRRLDPLFNAWQS